MIGPTDFFDDLGANNVACGGGHSLRKGAVVRSILGGNSP